MSKNRRNNRLCALRALAAVLIMASALSLMGSTLIDPDSMKADEVQYTTAQVELGSIVKEMNSGASLYFPKHIDLRCKVRNARVTQMTSTRTDSLTQGLELGVLHSESSRADLSQTSLSLQRAKQEMSEGLRSREEAIVEKQQSLHELPAEQREIARLEILKMQIELEDYRLRQQRNIASLEERMEEQEEELQDVVLTAPATGKVSYYSYLNLGDSVSYNQVILTVDSQDVVLLRIEDAAAKWRYGMIVQVGYGPRNKQKTCLARIISADNVRNPLQQQGYAYAKLLEDVPIEELTYVTVSAEEFRVDNVLVIPRKAHKLSHGQNMVSILSGRSVANRAIRIGLSAPQTSWVLQGLEEGQSLILD